MRRRESSIASRRRPATLDRRVRPERGVHARLRAGVDDQHQGRRAAQPSGAPSLSRCSCSEVHQVVHAGEEEPLAAAQVADQRMVERAWLGLVAGDRLGRGGERAPALGEQEERACRGPRPRDRGCRARPAARRPATRRGRPARRRGPASAASRWCGRRPGPRSSPPRRRARAAAPRAGRSARTRGRRRSPRAAPGSAPRFRDPARRRISRRKASAADDGLLVVDRLPHGDHVRGARLKGGQPCGGRHRYRS